MSYYSDETQEQIALFSWAQIMEHKYPELKWMYHVPNEGKRSAAVGAMLKAAGLKRGAPDVVLPVARGGYHSLYIELKTETGVVTKDQKAFLEALNAAGNHAVVCRCWYRAKDVIEKYLRGEIVKNDGV